MTAIFVAKNEEKEIKTVINNCETPTGKFYGFDLNKFDNFSITPFYYFEFCHFLQTHKAGNMPIYTL